MPEKHDLLGYRGLILPMRLVRRLDKLGIFAQAQVSLEHQHLARRYVARGIESGGAVRNIGRYVTFCGPAGEQLPYLHPIDTVGVNAIHAVVVAPILMRIEVFRSGRTCQLLITRHEVGPTENGRRPPLLNSVAFRGVNGFLESGERRTGNGSTDCPIPRFWSRSGEQWSVPRRFAPVVQAATRGASCCGCSHSHFLIAPAIMEAVPARAAEQHASH